MKILDDENMMFSKLLVKMFYSLNILSVFLS